MMNEAHVPPSTASPYLRRFAGVDIIKALGDIVNRNTVLHRHDFAIDRETLMDAAQSANQEDRCFLWLSRWGGTECHSERSVYMRDSSEHNAWTYYASSVSGEQRIVACAVDITGMVNGKVRGDLYELDYRRHVEMVKDNARNPETALLTFDGGRQRQFPFEEYDKRFERIQRNYGSVLSRRLVSSDEPALRMELTRQLEIRQRLPPCRFAELMRAMDTNQPHASKTPSRRHRAKRTGSKAMPAHQGYER